MATLFIGVLILARIDSDEWQEWFLVSTLSIVVMLNVCTAIYQGGLIGVCGKFPPHYMGGMMAGQALGGIFPATVNILVIAMDVEAEDIGFYCFLIAFIFVLLSLVAYCAVQTTDFFRFYAGTGGGASLSTDTSNLRNLWGVMVKCGK
jgi:equilibrative nucleoside transporter 1/2/3